MRERRRVTNHLAIEKCTPVVRQAEIGAKWDESNANQFFDMFGTDFKLAMGKRIKESDELRASVAAFLEVRNERNKLVHQDYATFAMGRRWMRYISCIKTCWRL